MLTRVSRGAYAVGDVDEAKRAAARVGGAVSHLSAAIAHGWKVAHPPQQPTVTIARNRRRVQADGVDLRRGDLTGQGLVTTPARTVIDCARTLGFGEAVAVADSALRSGAVTRDELLREAASSPRTGRSRAERVVAAADARADNPFESLLRVQAQAVPGLCVVPQGEIDVDLHPDLVDFGLQIAIEADSFTYHALPEAFEYDVRRYTDLVRRGWLVVRFTWADVMQRPAYVDAVLRDVVALRAGRAS